MAKIISDIPGIRSIDSVQSFRIGSGQTFHEPLRAEGVKIVAKCGAYGFVDYSPTEPEGAKGQGFESRPATPVWIAAANCKRCAIA